MVDGHLSREEPSTSEREEKSEEHGRFTYRYHELERYEARWAGLNARLRASASDCTLYNNSMFSDIDIGNLIEDASAKDEGTVDNVGGEQLEPVLEQLATHVPDLIVFRSHDAPLPQTIHSYGVVMFTDISGKLPRVGTMETMFTLYCHTFSLYCRIHSFV